MLFMYIILPILSGLIVSAGCFWFAATRKRCPEYKYRNFVAYCLRGVYLANVLLIFAAIVIFIVLVVYVHQNVGFLYFASGAAGTLINFFICDQYSKYSDVKELRQIIDTAIENAKPECDNTELKEEIWEKVAPYLLERGNYELADDKVAEILDSYGILK